MLYIHVPFCHSKCHYCAFYSTASQRDKAEYVAAVCREIEARRGELTESVIKTVYFGGGTPSLLTTEAINMILEACKTWGLAKVEEATIECNPENMTSDYLASLRGLRFFNRVSMGVQSFNDDELRLMGRRHTAQEALETIARIEAAGFDNISIDLIYGLPSQTVAHWRRNLERLTEVVAQHGAVRHLSCYALTIENQSVIGKLFERGELVPCSEEVVLEQYEMLQEWCKKNGFEQYEISSYCRPGYHSRHNSGYWNRTHYCGFGPSAHSFDGRSRRWNISNLRQYIANPTESYEKEILTASDAYNEQIMTALRTVGGIEKEAIAAERRPTLHQAIARFIKAGLIEETATHYRPTHDGLLQADGIASELFE